jgi:hypothetical protein
MKTKHLSLPIAALLVAAGLWLARSRHTDLRTHALKKTTTGARVETQHGQPRAGQLSNSPARLAPPDPSRRFRDFTPEQRVQFARQGHGPGG